jgi:hypothetical protein
MKKLLLLFALFSISSFADHGCRNKQQIAYQAKELARETRELIDRGHGRHGDRFADEARRLAKASWELGQAARGNSKCRLLTRMFTERVEPAFRDLMDEIRRPGRGGRDRDDDYRDPRRDDRDDDLRDVRRAFNDLRRELFEDDNDRDPRPIPFPTPRPRH